MRRYLKLLRYASLYRGRFLLLLATTVLASVVSALQPWPMKLVVDHLLSNTPLPAALQSVFQKLSISTEPAKLLPVIVLAGLLIYLLNGALEAALAWGWTSTGRRTVNDLAHDVFARLQRRSLSFHSRTEVGDSISRVMVDSWCVYQLLHTVSFAAFQAMLTTIATIVLMGLLQPILMLISLAVVPLMVGASLLLGKRLRAAAKDKREIETRIQSHIQQTLSGMPVVQAFVQEEREHERFRQFAAQAIDAQQRSTFLGSLGGLSSGLITTIGTGVIIWAGAHFVGEGKLTVGGLLVFLVYLNSLQAQTKVLAGVYPTALNIGASVDRVNEVLDAQLEIVDKPNALPLDAARGHIKFENVTTGYDPDRSVLLDVSLEVRPGEALAIVGPTGAGKSTLVSMIPRFLDPMKGRVLLDGHDVRDLQLDALRSQISIVLQEPFLFPFSIAENIAWGREGASRKEIEEAARTANAHDFITRMPEGYDTIMGERGATLSGGERQRIAIARALLKNAPVLILDEPTSALDSETENLLLEALERLMAGRTTLIIAHRLSTIRRANQIVVLKAGRICEAGTHQQLLAQDGVYAHLHKLQFRPATDVAIEATGT
ncbi:MAG: ABC transporter ATP-binding protein [Limisphaerales bacterium]